MLAVSILEEARGKGHAPSVAFLCDGSRAPLVACRLCGCTAEARAVGLAQPCHRGERMSKGNAHRLQRFMKGLRPRRDESLDGPWPEMPGATMLLRDAGPALPELCTAGVEPKAWHVQCAAFVTSLDDLPGSIRGAMAAQSSRGLGLEQDDL